MNFEKLCCEVTIKEYVGSLSETYEISIYLFVQFFLGYYWNITSSCLQKRCRKYSNFVRFLRLPKRIIFKNMIFLFLLLKGVRLNTILETIPGWIYIQLPLQWTLPKLEKICFFQVTSQKHYKLIYINYNQR